MRLRRPIRHWFLPQEHDVLGDLQAQMTITLAGIEAFAAWAAGDLEAAEKVGRIEHEADEAKRAVRVGLRDTFITPISAEDIFTLSQLLDKVLNDSKDVVREAEVMDMAPNAPMAEMAERLEEGTQHLSRAFEALAGQGEHSYRVATAAADDATKSARRMEKVYRRAMSELLELEAEELPEGGHLREVMGRRELYRRLSRIAETMADVAARVWYAAVKEL